MVSRIVGNSATHQFHNDAASSGRVFRPEKTPAPRFYPVRIVQDTFERNRNGTVQAFDKISGIGFVVPIDGGDQVILYRSFMKRSGFADLNEGELLKFDTIRSRARPGKLVAVNIRRSN